MTRYDIPERKSCDNRYDAIYFMHSLHHFDDFNTIFAHCKQLLNPNGVLIAVEPARDWHTVTDMTFVALIRLLLADYGGWYETLSMPQTLQDLEHIVSEMLNEYREARDKGEPQQSPHDNSSHASDMLVALRAHFEEIAFAKKFAFLPRIIGGIRGTDEEQIMRIVALLTLFDEFAVNSGVLQPGVYEFAGRLRKT